MTPHPNVRARKPRDVSDVVRAMVFAPDSLVADWVEDELGRRQITYQLGRTVEQIIAGLTEDPPPRAQLLVVDFDAMEAAGVLHLHTIREQGWFGIVIGLGHVPEALRRSLGIDHVIEPPYHRDALGERLGGSIGNGVLMATTRIERIGT